MLHMSVARAQQEISAREFVEWQAAERILGPLDVTRGDIVGAIIAGAATNAQRTADEQVHPKVFIPEFGKQEPEPTNLPDKINSVMSAMSLRFPRK